MELSVPGWECTCVKTIHEPSETAPGETTENEREDALTAFDQSFFPFTFHRYGFDVSKIRRIKFYVFENFNEFLGTV